MAAASTVRRAIRTDSEPQGAGTICHLHVPSLFDKGQRAGYTSSEKFLKSEFFKVASHLLGLAGLTSQFLNGTHEFSVLVLGRMALLMDQSRSVLVPAPVGQSPGQSTGIQRVGPLHLNWPEPVFFSRAESTNEKQQSSFDAIFTNWKQKCSYGPLHTPCYSRRAELIWL